MEPKRFLRSKNDRVFAGVCGGIAEYFSIDPLLIRVLFVVLVFAGGGGVLIYLILWIATPEKPGPYIPVQNAGATENPQTPPEGSQNTQSTQNSPAQPAAGTTIEKPRKPMRGLIGGLVLITLGILFLIAEFVPSVDFGDLWPILLVVIGIGLLLKSVSGRKQIN